MGESWPGAVQGEILEDFSARKPVPEVVTRDTIYSLGQMIQERPLIKALFYFTYLTGARITEALMVSRSDIQSETLKGQPIITIKLRTLKKKRGTKFRVVPVWISKENNPTECKMWNVIKPYVTRTQTGHIFILGGSPGRVRRRIGYYFGRDIKLTTKAVYKMKFLDSYEFSLYPHYLRHCRLTHMAQIYGFDEMKLMQFAGWSSTKPAAIYVHYNWIDLAKWMVK